MVSRKHFTASEDDFLDLISQVYDAGMAPSLWNQTLKSIANFFHAEQSNLRVIDPDSRKINQYYNYNRDPFWIQAYKDYYYKIDPWMDMLQNSIKPIVSCTNHILTDREYRRLEAYNDYVIPTDTHFAMGGLIKVNQDFKTYLGLQKSYNSGEFHNEQLCVFKKIIPHINKSIQINQHIYQLEFQQNTLKQALDQINSAILLVNEKRQLLFMNSTAEILIVQRKDIIIDNRVLTLYSAPPNRQLEKLIYNATFGIGNASIVDAGGMQYQPVTGGQALSIIVSPLRPGHIDFDIKGKKVAMVIISETGKRTQPAQEMLSAIYQLTNAEARVVSLLCSGLSINDICEQLHLTMNTVKTHLKSAFQKTGTRRQAELVTLINTGPVGIMYS